jgi:hypothetical protein
MHKNESPGSFQNLERKRRDSLLVRNVSPSKQQVTLTPNPQPPTPNPQPPTPNPLTPNP